MPSTRIVVAPSAMMRLERWELSLRWPWMAMDGIDDESRIVKELEGQLVSMEVAPALVRSRCGVCKLHQIESTGSTAHQVPSR